MNTDSKFRKAERIVSQKTIDDLFSGTGSQSLVAFPIRAVYKTYLSPIPEHGSPARPFRTLSPERTRSLSTLHLPPSTILISVPKRRFKHAVDRNRVKRQLRESYRHHKTLLTDRIPLGQTVSIAFIWLSDDHFPSAVIDKRVESLLKRIADRLSC